MSCPIASSCAACRATSAPTTSYIRRCWAEPGKRSPSASVGRRWVVVNHAERLPPWWERPSAIANTGSSGRRRGPHRPQHEVPIRAEDPIIISRVADAPSRPKPERGSPARHRQQHRADAGRTRERGGPGRRPRARLAHPAGRRHRGCCAACQRCWERIGNRPAAVRTRGTDDTLLPARPAPAA